MLPKKNRFSFKTAVPKSAFHSGSFTVRYAKNDEGMRVAVVVSKKVDKRAVVRNKIKRRLIAIVQKEIDKNKPFNLIFYVKQAALNSKDLEREVREALRKVI